MTTNENHPQLNPHQMLQLDPSNMTREEVIEALKMLDAKEEIEKDAFLENFVGSTVQTEFLLDKSKIRIVQGANRSGKSLIGAIDIIIRATGVIPNYLKGIYPEEMVAIGEYWVVSLDFTSSVEITQSKIFQAIPKRMIVDFNKETKRLTLTNGSVIGFKSDDQGWEKFQGTSKRGIWIDEEGSKKVWDECFMRTIDCAGFMTLTFTPLKGLTWAYKELFMKATSYRWTVEVEPNKPYENDMERIENLKNRKLFIIPNTSADTNPDIELFGMATYDNKYLTNSEILKVERKWQDDPVMWNSRILGRFSKITGRNVFDVQKLQTLQTSLLGQGQRGELLDNRFYAKLKGNLTIFKEKKPMGSGHYVISGDVAEGLEFGDFSCMQVFDRLTWEQVAVWHGKVDTGMFADEMVRLAKYYNNAYIAPETNFHGHAVVERIRKHHKYIRLFSFYDQVKDASEGIKSKKRYGWNTTEKSKSIMIQKIATSIREGSLKLNDFNTIEELITYVFHEDGSMGGLSGCHDDRVMALGIALMLCKLTPIPNDSGEHITNTDATNELTGY